MNESMHETYARAEAARAGSDRSFGLVMAGVFGVLAAVNGWHAGARWPWLAGIAAVFLAAALLFPSSLTVLNKLWFKFGLLLHHVVNPIIMGLIFFVTVFPTGLVFRLLGKDILRLKREPDSDSYWISRPPGPAAETMKDQF
jgi:saxitoxin biosynthesis operon SxtJ-like protein